MIGPMNLGVTIQTGFSKDALIFPCRRDPRATVHAAGVEIGAVALLAQPGLTGNQQVGVIPAVGNVAVGAVFTNRGMLPQERAAFFCMAVVAGFIDVVAHQ